MHSGADVVEVAPVYDSGNGSGRCWYIYLLTASIGDITGTAAADLVHDFLSLFVAEGSRPQTSGEQKPLVKDEL
jgi:arginase family enzyme